MKKFFATIFSTLWLAACAQESVSKDAGWEEDGLAGEENFFSENSAGADDQLPWPEGRYISCEEVYTHLQAGDGRMLTLNVADEEFYNLGSIPGSLKIPWDELPNRLAEVDEEKYIVVYCRRGVRSEPAYDTLDGAGYPHKWIMEGGIERWNQLGYPTEK